MASARKRKLPISQLGVGISEDAWPLKPSQPHTASGSTEATCREHEKTPLPRSPALSLKSQEPPPAVPAKSFWNWLAEQANQLFNIMRHYAAWIGFFNLVSASTLARIPSLLLRITEFISPVARMVTGLRLLNNTVLHFQGRWTRVFGLIGGICFISLGVAALIWPPFGLSFTAVNIAGNVVLGLWFLAVALKNKYYGPWKKEQDALKLRKELFYESLAQGNNLAIYLQYRKKDCSALRNKANLPLCKILEKAEQEIIARTNKHNKLNIDLAIKAHNTGFTFLAVIGITLAFFPPTMVAGAAILLAVSFHGLLFGYDLAGRWPKKMQNYFFRPGAFASAEELTAKTAHYQAAASPLSSTATTQLSLLLNADSLRRNTSRPSSQPNSPAPPQNEVAPTNPASTRATSLWQSWLSWFNRPSIEGSDTTTGFLLDAMPSLH